MQLTLYLACLSCLLVAAVHPLVANSRVLIAAAAADVVFGPVTATDLTNAIAAALATALTNAAGATFSAAGAAFSAAG